MLVPGFIVFETTFNYEGQLGTNVLLHNESIFRPLAGACEFYYPLTMPPDQSTGKRNRVFWNTHGFIEIAVVGLQSAASVKQMGDEIIALAQELRAQGQPVFLLDDLRQMHPRQPIEVGRAVGTQVRRINFDRAALLGTNSLLLKYGTNFIIKATGKTETTKYFQSRRAAEAWLLNRKIRRNPKFAAS